MNIIKIFITLLLLADVANAEIVRKLIDDKYHHLGEGISYEFYDRNGDNTWKKTFSLSSLSGETVYLEMDAIICSGGLLIINGKEVALPLTMGNVLERRRYNHQLAIMALPSNLFKVGTNTLEFVAEAGYYQYTLNYEIGKLYIIYEK